MCSQHLGQYLINGWYSLNCSQWVNFWELTGVCKKKIHLHSTNKNVWVRYSGNVLMHYCVSPTHWKLLISMVFWRRHYHKLPLALSLSNLGGSVVKNLCVNKGDTGDSGLIPGSGRSPRGGNGNPVQYLCWEIPWQRSLVCYIQFIRLPRVRYYWATDNAHTRTVINVIRDADTKAVRRQNSRLSPLCS